MERYQAFLEVLRELAEERMRKQSTERCILTPGGTFDKQYDPVRGELGFSQTSVEEILRTAGVCPDVNIRFVNPFLKDSREITDADRATLVAACRDAPTERLVVVHGTDTMTISAERIARAHLPKVIVLVGAFVPFCCKASDAPFNLGFAVAAARMINRSGVYVAMNGKVAFADKVMKAQSRHASR